MIIGDEPRVFELLEEYEGDSNEDKLKENIVRLVRPEEGTQSVYFLNLDPMVIKGLRDHSPPEQDDVKILILA